MNEELELFRVRAERVLVVAFGGEHHVYALKWSGETSCTFLINDGAATYDYADLTRLVVSCHDECVRGEIRNGGPRRLRVTLSSRVRKSKHPDIYACPTLDQHVEQIRRGGNYQPLFNLLRAEKEQGR